MGGWIKHRRELNVTVRSYKDLRIWQLGMNIVESVYEATRGFPQDRKKRRMD